MKVPEGLQSALWATPVAASVALAGFLSRDVIIEQYMFPAVIIDLERAGGTPDDAPIGRMHRDDDHALFVGVGEGIGNATVHFPGSP